MSWKQRLGPSLLHAAGALAFQGVVSLIAVWLTGRGLPALFYGAAASSFWFIGREVEQLWPHLGWKSRRLVDVSAEDLTRAARQAGLPFLLTHALATAAAYIS